MAFQVSDSYVSEVVVKNDRTTLPLIHLMFIKKKKCQWSSEAKYNLVQIKHNNQGSLFESELPKKRKKRKIKIYGIKNFLGFTWKG